MKLLFSVMAALALTLSASFASAHEFKVGDLEIMHPTTRAMLPGAKVGGGFLTIINHGSEDDTLVSVSTSRADMAQLHEMAIENDVMKMREKVGGIAIPAGETVELKPGGLHVMFMKVTEPFKEGEMLKSTLVFEKAGPVDIEFTVGGVAGDMKEMDHGAHKMDMDSSETSN